MAIGEQFTGLDMENLIGGPLAAAATASNSLANSTAEFINRVGFDAGGKLRTAAFMYQKRSANDDGTINVDEMKVDVPMLAIVPIPNLQVDEVNILFDMEVKQSEKSESATDLSATASGSLNLGIVKVNITGSVSSHSSNTRSSDNSAKYHVDVRATNHGTPEGLARVLDMMAANVAPSLVNSTPKDANGRDLPAESKARVERLKEIREEISQLDHKTLAARNALDSKLMQFKKLASAQQKAYQAKLIQLMDKETEDSPKYQEYSTNINDLNQIWNNFQLQAGDTIKMLAAQVDVSGKKDDINQAVNTSLTQLSEIFALKGINDQGQLVPYAKAGQGETANQYEAMQAAQNSAVVSQISTDSMENELLEKKSEYNSAIAGKPLLASKTPDNQSGKPAGGTTP